MVPEPRHRARPVLPPWSAGVRRALALVAVLAVIAAGVVTGLLLGRGDGDAAGGGTGEVAALGPLTGPPTLFGRVREVIDPATVVVDVQGRPVRVSVVGVDTAATPECARADALAFARETLDDEEVTLVPDPTLPAPAADTAAWPAYLVTASQQSYTDAALVAGWVSPGEGRYRPGFEAGERIAQERNAGMWGPPCDRQP